MLHLVSAVVFHHRLCLVYLFCLCRLSYPCLYCRLYLSYRRFCLCFYSKKDSKNEVINFLKQDYRVCFFRRSWVNFTHIMNKYQPPSEQILFAPSQSIYVELRLSPFTIKYTHGKTKSVKKVPNPNPPSNTIPMARCAS